MQTKIISIICWMVIFCSLTGCSPARNTKTKHESTNNSGDAWRARNAIDFSLESFENKVNLFAYLAFHMGYDVANKLGFSYNFNYGMNLFIDPGIVLLSKESEEFAQRLNSVERLILGEMVRLHKYLSKDPERAVKSLDYTRVVEQDILLNRNFPQTTMLVSKILLLFELLAQVRPPTASEIANGLTSTPSVISNIYYLHLIQKLVPITTFEEIWHKFSATFYPSSLSLCFLIPFKESTDDTEDSIYEPELDSLDESLAEADTIAGMLKDVHSPQLPTIELLKAKNELFKYMHNAERSKCFLNSYLSAKNLVLLALTDIVDQSFTDKLSSLAPSVKRLIEKLFGDASNDTEKSKTLMQFYLKSLNRLAKGAFSRPPRVAILNSWCSVSDTLLITSGLPDETPPARFVSSTEFDLSLTELMQQVSDIVELAD